MKENKKKFEFEVKVGDSVLKLKTVPISPEVRMESNKPVAEAFQDALRSGALLSAEAEKILEERGLLDNDSEADKISKIRKETKELEIKLRRGIGSDGNRMTVEEGRTLALAIKSKRKELNKVGGSKAEIVNRTAEAQADNERFQYFIYACTLKCSDGSHYWPSYEAFKEESNKDIQDAAMKSLIALMLGSDKDYEKDYYENKWLMRMGFMNDKLQFIKDGKLVDEEGRLIDEDGRFINESGQFVDIYGNLVDKEGNLLEVDTWATDESAPKSPPDNSLPTDEVPKAE